MQFPGGKDTQERIDTPEKSDPVLVNSREAKVGAVPATRTPPGRELNRPGFEKDEFGCGFDAKAGRICASTDEDLIRGQVWDGQENLEFKRQGARRAGKGPVGP